MRFGRALARVGPTIMLPRPAVEPTQFFALSLDMLRGSGHDGYFQRVSPGFSRTLGYADIELLDHAFSSFVHPDDRGATIAELDKLSYGRPTYAFEHRFRRRDGDFRWLSWTAVPTPEALVYAAASDVTERKRLDTRRAPAVGARGGVRMAQPDGYLVSVSHDLQQPLTVIKGQAQVMQRR